MSSQLSGIELLELGDSGRQKTVLTKYWGQFLGVSFGLLTGVVINYATKRPMLSGVQKYVLAVGGWTSLLTFAQHKREEYNAEKDAVLRHYIQLHPEDFPVPERKKIGDLLEEWVPIR